MLKLLLLFVFLCAEQLQAESSLFHKVSTLRFGPEKVVRAIHGSVDISAMGDQEAYHIQGEILFFPEEFLEPVYYTPEDFERMIASKKPVKVDMRLKSTPEFSADIPSNFGTFVLRIRSQSPKKLVFSMPRFFHPISISMASVHESKEILSLGQVNSDPTQNRLLYSFTAGKPSIQIHGDIYLFAKVSTAANPKSASTPNISSFFLGEESFMRHYLYTNLYFVMGISGGFLLMFVYYFFIYIFRVKDISSLYLSLYALCSYGLSAIYVLEFPLSSGDLVDMFTSINVMSICFLQFYLADKIKFLFSKRILRLMQAFALCTALGAVVSVLLNVGILIALFFFSSFLSSTGLILATMYFGLRYRLSGIYYFLFGALLNCSLQFSIMMSYIRLSNEENGYSILLANFFMAMGLALVNAKEFATTYQKSLEQSRDLELKNREITFFNKNLERLVSHKTQEIRALLDYIPQGVLSIGVGGMIAKDFSAHLLAILEVQDVGQKSFKELVLDNCLISGDSKDQAWQAIQASVGDSMLNFEMNEDKFPRELQYKAHAGNKYLKVTWNIEVEGDTVVRLLVTLLDITVEKELERESGKQRQELIMIQELINVPAHKMAQFFSTSNPLMREMERIILDSHNLDLHMVRMLFVNAHTVKGAARTLLLKGLARVVHEMEEYYSDILRRGVPIDQERLKQDCHRALDIFKMYEDINRNKLNRSDDYNKVVIERDFIEHHYQILNGLVNRTDFDPGNVVQVIREQSEALTLLIFDQLPALFEGYRDRAVKIAKDMNKAEPNFELNVDSVSVPHHLRSVLDNCMIHLLRNALDHGVEGVDERLNKQKPASGTIMVRANLVNNVLQIELSDDGRGLAIEKLRVKGRQLGLIKPTSSLHDIANLIFQSGVSTAHAVSDISGRGVGMNAVRTFLENVQGSIAVRLGNPKDEHGHYYDFAFVLNLPLGAIAASLVKAS